MICGKHGRSRGGKGGQTSNRITEKPVRSQMRGADGFFLFIAKKFPLGGSGNDGKGRVLMKKQWGQIGGKLGANFQKCPANPRKSMKKRASSPFYWSRKRESNPPGSAWEADAIPLGDSCIFGCILFVSRFRGNGSTFAPLRGARWLAHEPAGISLGS